VRHLKARLAVTLGLALTLMLPSLGVVSLAGDDTWPPRQGDKPPQDVGKCPPPPKDSKCPPPPRDGKPPPPPKDGKCPPPPKDGKCPPVPKDGGPPNDNATAQRYGWAR